MISIHAPARGATKWLALADLQSIISIHAPARGATARGALRGPGYLFQSTLPQGERLPDGRTLSLSTPISIHAPARGATVFGFDYDEELYGFQSTLPQGERLKGRTGAGTLTHFNPRSRKGSDTITKLSVAQTKTFQSTLPQGERLPLSLCLTDCRMISIHAPARGATKQELSDKVKLYISIHAPARGATVPGSGI